ADREERLSELADAHYYPIFVIGSTHAPAGAAGPPKDPGIWCCLVDDGSVDAPKVLGMQFNEEQGSYLVGAAAALTSKTGKVGFIGAVPDALLQKYEVGFTAGGGGGGPPAHSRAAPRPPLPAAPRRPQRPGQGQEGRAGHVRRGCRCDLRGGRRHGQ